jgi:hypothetical protein
MQTAKQLGQVVCLLVGCLSALSASAQQTKNERAKWEIFAQGAGSFHSHVSGFAAIQNAQPPLLLRVSKSFAKTGRFFTGLRYHFDSKNHIEASFSYSPGRLNVTISRFPPLHPHASVLWLDCDYWSFNYVRRLPGGRNFEPFLTAGFGILVFNHGFDPGHDDETKPLGNVGLGLDIPLHRWSSLRLEQRVFVSGTPRISIVSPDPLKIKGKTYDFVPSVGLVWHF